MTKYLPGNPHFVVRNKPGAASLNLVNELYNVLPRDGSVIGMFARSVAMDRLLGREGANFNPVELNWIGSANNEVSICARLAWRSASTRRRSSWRARSSSPPMRPVRSRTSIRTSSTTCSARNSRS